jgi:hypothetical protein
MNAQRKKALFTDDDEERQKTGPYSLKNIFSHCRVSPSCFIRSNSSLMNAVGTVIILSPKLNMRKFLTKQKGGQANIKKPLLAQWIYLNPQILQISQTDLDSEDIWDFEKPN